MHSLLKLYRWNSKITTSSIQTQIVNLEQNIDFSRVKINYTFKVCLSHYNQYPIIPSIQIYITQSILQILKMRNNTSQLQKISYSYLRLPFEQEPDMTYTSGFNYELTIRHSRETRFKKAKQDILSQDSPLQRTAMAVMRILMIFPTVRGTPKTKDYIRQRLIDICYKFMSNSSRFRRYEACSTLDNIAEDPDLCLVLIEKNCLNKLLTFIGKEEHIQIRNTASSALRKVIDKICTNENPNEQLINEIFDEVKVKLSSEKKRVKVRQMVWIALRIYKSKVECQVQNIVLAVVRISCEVIKREFLKPGQEQVLTYALQTLDSIFRSGNKYKHYLIWCIRDYKISGLLMEYADSEEQYSGTAMEILKHFAHQDQNLHEKQEYLNSFFKFASSLIKKHEEKLPKIIEICKILKSISKNKHLTKTLFQKIQLLKKLNRLPQKNPQLLKNDLQFSYIMCEIYYNMINRTKSQDAYKIIDLIINSNSLQTLVKLTSSDTEKKTALTQVLKIISGMLQFDKEKDKRKLILTTFQQLGIIQKLKNLVENPHPNFDSQTRDIAVKILETYWPKEKIKQEGKQQKQDKPSKQDKQDQDDKDGQEGEAE